MWCNFEDGVLKLPPGFRNLCVTKRYYAAPLKNKLPRTTRLLWAPQAKSSLRVFSYLSFWTPSRYAEADFVVASRARDNH